MNSLKGYHVDNTSHSLCWNYQLTSYFFFSFWKKKPQWTIFHVLQTDTVGNFGFSGSNLLLHSHVSYDACIVWIVSLFWPSAAVAQEWTNCPDEPTQPTLRICKIRSWNGNISWDYHERTDFCSYRPKLPIAKDMDIVIWRTCTKLSVTKVVVICFK